MTANFPNSAFILKTGVPQILRRRTSEGLIVFPIIAKPCAWQKATWLAKMNVKFRNGDAFWRAGGHYADHHLGAIVAEAADIIHAGKNGPHVGPFVDVIEPKTIPAHAGSFWMGGSPEDEHAQSTELPGDIMIHLPD